MTNVSKRPLPDEYFEQLFSEVALVISRVDRETAPSFLEEFFTPAEKVMFTKRLTAVLLFTKEHSVYRVADMLNMSTSTTKKMHDHYERGGYAHMVECLEDKPSAIADFLKKLYFAYEEELMRQAGKGRWKNI